MLIIYIKEILIAILIGLTEGITEFLPISSTAHMRLVAFGVFGGGDIDSRVGNVFQLAALIAILQFFWVDLSSIGRRIWEFRNVKEFKNFVTNFKSWMLGTKVLSGIKNDSLKTDIIIAQLIIATIPIGIAGLVFRQLVDNLRQNVAWIGVFLIFGAILMYVSERVWNKKKIESQPQQLTFWQTLVIGCWQSLAILPGISRSGATISGGYLMGIHREYLVRTVFLLSIPALFLAGVKDTLSLLKELKNLHFWPQEVLLNQGNLSILGIIIGAFFAYISALLTLKWLIKFLSTNSFDVFVIYRIVLGVVLIIISKG